MSEKREFWRPWLWRGDEMSFEEKAERDLVRAMNFEETAERIVRVHGTSVALAGLSGIRSDLSLAREVLKQAIVKALAECSGVQTNTRKERTVLETAPNDDRLTANDAERP